ncbi:hypothetical protein EHQ76_17110 [Leptospira barantonii]|uniref:DUF1574 domain-containing protein n=1 Tax=Leptospira barantonii TaxID=2023184 RepID=A0A5F2AYV9_9LEPT|nr:hypothetical protein [Leptospira barantonii]TGL95106.1 hypothetical protein EHQ76_17110 [Leptospira barantonii]
MDPVSSTSSSKILRYTSLTLVLLLSVFLFDRVWYALLFGQYDKMFSMIKNFKPANTLIVGSSHILWDLDAEVLAKESGKQVVLLNVPGANLTLRKEIVSEYLRKNKNQLPSLLVLETDKFAFNKERYPDSAYKSVKGYYHKGLFRNFLDKKVPEESLLEYWTFRISHSYSLNSYSHFIFSKLYDKYLSSLFVWKLNAEEPNRTVSEMRVSRWKKQYEGLSPKLEPELIQELYDILKLTRHYGVKAVLLETPNYRFSKEDDSKYEVVREELKKIAEGSGAIYMRLNPEEFETDPETFFDASHMNPFGKAGYTAAFRSELKKRNLL